MMDMHCHILYGIDDGCKTIKESIETIKNIKRRIIKKWYRNQLILR